jgi:iron complex outermembrane receptor protein
MTLAIGMIADGGRATRAQSIEDLGKLSIEQLANIEVTSVTKSPEPLSRAAASVYVITASDIIRSGATNLPEVLRLAPNLEVARLNAYNWAITARGFNSPEADNKLLVLIEGAASIRRSPIRILAGD